MFGIMMYDIFQKYFLLEIYQSIFNFSISKSLKITKKTNLINFYIKYIVKTHTKQVKMHVNQFFSLIITRV